MQVREIIIVGASKRFDNFHNLGGVIAVFDQASAKISNGNFSNNMASLGGVISGQYYSYTHFTHCIFSENEGKYAILPFSNFNYFSL